MVKPYISVYFRRKDIFLNSIDKSTRGCLIVFVIISIVIVCSLLETISYFYLLECAKIILFEFMNEAMNQSINQE